MSSKLKESFRERFRRKKIEKKLKSLPLLGKIRKLKRKKIYVKEKCHYTENGIRCTRNCIGSGQLCAIHGGEKDLSNFVSKEALQLRTAVLGKITKFNPAIHPLQMIDLSRQGLSDVEIAAEMEVGITTLRGWADTYEEFAVAHDIGQALYESWWLQKGKDGLDQRNFNTTLFKFLTGNKLGYADKVETKNLNLTTHGVLVVPAKQSIEEWEVDINDIKEVREA